MESVSDNGDTTTRHDLRASYDTSIPHESVASLVAAPDNHSQTLVEHQKADEDLSVRTAAPANDEDDDDDQDGHNSDDDAEESTTTQSKQQQGFKTHGGPAASASAAADRISSSSPLTSPIAPDHKDDSNFGMATMAWNAALPLQSILKSTSQVDDTAAGSAIGPAQPPQIHFLQSMEIACTIATYLGSVDLALSFCCIHSACHRASDNELRRRTMSRRIHRSIGSVSVSRSSQYRQPHLASDLVTTVVSIRLTDGIQVTYAKEARSTFFELETESLKCVGSGLVYGILTGPLAREVVTLPHRRRSDAVTTASNLAHGAQFYDDINSDDDDSDGYNHANNNDGGVHGSDDVDETNGALLSSLPRRMQHEQSHIEQLRGWWLPVPPEFLQHRLTALFSHTASQASSKPLSGRSSARSRASRTPTVANNNPTLQALNRTMRALHAARVYFPLLFHVTARFLRGDMELVIQNIIKSVFDASFVARLPTNPSSSLLRRVHGDALACRLSARSVIRGELATWEYELGSIPRVGGHVAASSVVPIRGFVAVPYVHLRRPVTGNGSKLAAIVAQTPSSSLSAASSGENQLGSPLLPSLVSTTVTISVFVDGLAQPAGCLQNVSLSAPLSEIRFLIRSKLRWLQAVVDGSTFHIFRAVRKQHNGMPDKNPFSRRSNRQAAPSSAGSRRSSARSNRLGSTATTVLLPGGLDPHNDEESLLLVDALPPVHGQYLQRMLEGYEESVCGWLTADVSVLHDCALAVILCPRASLMASNSTMTNPQASLQSSTADLQGPAGRVRHLRAQKAKDALKDVHPALQMYFIAQGAALDAARRGDVQTLLHLLDQQTSSSSNNNMTSSSSLTSKHVAGMVSNRLPADLPAVTPQDRSACLLMHVAAEHGRKAVLELLIGRGFPVDRRDSDGQLPLHRCAFKGHAECIPVILRAPKGIDGLNTADARGRTPLHLALEAHFINTALWLIEQGANPDVRDPAGRSCADVACVQLQDVTTLCRTGDVEGVRSLLSGALPISESALSSDTASATWYTEALKHRLTRGRLLFGLRGQFGIHSRTGIAVPNVTHVNAIHEAVLCGHHQVVRMLLESFPSTMIDITEATSSGDTVLHLAARSRSSEMLPIVLDAFEKRNSRNGDEGAASASGYGSSSNSSAVMQALYCVNNCGETPLHSCLKHARASDIAAVFVYVLSRCQAEATKYPLGDFGHLVLHVADAEGLSICHLAVERARHLPDGVVQALLAAALSATQPASLPGSRVPSASLAQRFKAAFPQKEVSVRPMKHHKNKPVQANIFMMAVAARLPRMVKILAEFMVHCVQHEIAWPLAEFGALSSSGLLHVAYEHDDPETFDLLIQLQEQYTVNSRFRPFTNLDLSTTAYRTSRTEEGSVEIECVEVPVAWRMLSDAKSKAWIQRVRDYPCLLDSIREFDRAAYEYNSVNRSEAATSTLSLLVDHLVITSEEHERRRLCAKPPPAPPVLTTWGQFLLKPEEPTLEEVQKQWTSEQRWMDHRLHFKEKEDLIVYALQTILGALNPHAAGGGCMRHPTSIEEHMYERRVLFAAARCRGHAVAFSVLSELLRGTHVFSHDDFIRSTNLGVQYGLTPSAGVMFESLKSDGRMFTAGTASMKPTRSGGGGGGDSPTNNSRSGGGGGQTTRGSLFSRGSIRGGGGGGRLRSTADGKSDLSSTNNANVTSGDDGAAPTIVCDSPIFDDHPFEVKMRAREAQLCQLIPYVAAVDPGAFLHDLCARRMFGAAMTLLVTATANAHAATQDKVRGIVRSQSQLSGSNPNSPIRQRSRPRDATGDNSRDQRSTSRERSSSPSFRKPITLRHDNVNLRSREMEEATGVTAIHLAAQFGVSQLLHALLRTGQFGPREVSRARKWTPMHWAARYGHVDACRTLLSIGVPPSDVSDPTGGGSVLGTTPLHLAAVCGSTELVRVFLDHHAPVDPRTLMGRTPLHLAARKGRLEAALVLLDNGAKVEREDDDGNTPLLLAAQEGHGTFVLRVAAFLKRESLLLTVNRKTGTTLAHYASWIGGSSMQALLQKVLQVSATTIGTRGGGDRGAGGSAGASTTVTHTSDSTIPAGALPLGGKSLRVSSAANAQPLIDVTTSSGAPATRTSTAKALNGFTATAAATNHSWLDSASWLENNQSFIARPENTSLDKDGSALEIIAKSSGRTTFFESCIRSIQENTSASSPSAALLSSRMSPMRPTTARSETTVSEDASSWSQTGSTAAAFGMRRMANKRFGVHAILSSSVGTSSSRGDEDDTNSTVLKQVPYRTLPLSNSRVTVKPPRGGSLDVFNALVQATEERRVDMQDHELYRYTQLGVNIAKEDGEADLHLPDSFTQVHQGSTLTSSDPSIALLADTRGEHPWVPLHYALANGQTGSARILRDLMGPALVKQVRDVPLDREEHAQAVGAAKAAKERRRSEYFVRVLFPPVELPSIPQAILKSAQDVQNMIFEPLPPPPPPPKVWYSGYYGRGRYGMTGVITHSATASDLLPPQQDDSINNNNNNNGSFGGGRSEQQLDVDPPRRRVTAVAAASSPGAVAAPQFTFFELSRRRIMTSLAWMVSRCLCTELDRYIPLLSSVDEPVDPQVGLTLLMVAAHFNHVDVAEALLDHGAKVNAKATLLMRPLSEACVTPILFASAAGCLAMVDKLIERGADVDVADECGNTPVHHAVLHKDFRMLKSLLHAGAQIDVRNHSGDTPEDIAVALRIHNITRMLRWWSMTFLIEPSDLVAHRVPCRTEEEYKEWIESAQRFYKRLDLLHDNGQQLTNKVEHDSAPALMYIRLCQRLKVAPSKSVIGLLVPHWWPEEVHELRVRGVFLDDRSLVALFTFVKLLTHLEDLELSDCRITDEMIPALCTAAVQHPHLRRLHLSGNRGIERQGAMKLLELATTNVNIVSIDVTATGVEVPLMMSLHRRVELNMKQQSLDTEDPTRVQRPPTQHKPYHLPRVSDPNWVQDTTTVTTTQQKESVSRSRGRDTQQRE